MNQLLVSEVKGTVVGYELRLRLSLARLKSDVTNAGHAVPCILIVRTVL
eukprot:COSAG02_NODE_2270_length_9267_cov_13.803992_2_plen_49_part_00